MDDSSGDDELEHNAIAQEASSHDGHHTLDEIRTDPLPRPSRSEYADYNRLIRLPEPENAIDSALASRFPPLSDPRKTTKRIKGAVSALRKAFPLRQQENNLDLSDHRGDSQATPVNFGSLGVDPALLAIQILHDDVETARKLKLGNIDWEAYWESAATVPAFSGHPKVDSALEKLRKALPPTRSQRDVSDNVLQHRLGVLAAAKRKAQELDASIDLIAPVKLPRKQRSDVNRKRKRKRQTASAGFGEPPDQIAASE